MDSSAERGRAEYAFDNLDSGLSIAGAVRLAGDSAARRGGLLGIASLDREAGLWIRPCEAIHTFGMQMPLDVLFLDRHLKVKKLLEALPPYRIAVCLSAYSVVEIASGAIARSNTRRGDRLAVRCGSDHYRIEPEEPMSPGSTCPSS